MGLAPGSESAPVALVGLACVLGAGLLGIRAGLLGGIAQTLELRLWISKRDQMLVGLDGHGGWIRDWREGFGCVIALVSDNVPLSDVRN